MRNDKIIFGIIFGTLAIGISSGQMVFADPGEFEGRTGSADDIDRASTRSLELLEPQPIGVTFFGNGGVTADGMGSTSRVGTIQADVPAGSNVEQAYLYLNGIFSCGPQSDIVKLDGETITVNYIGDIGFACAFRGDVTSQVAAKIGTGGGVTDFLADYTVSRGSNGVALVVIYSNPALPEVSIAVMDGAQSTTGDTFLLGLASPLDKSVSGFLALMNIGITHGFQSGGQHVCGSGQASTIDVNGQRLTSCAGSYDDGQAANGALITVGGVGDLTDNPPNPNGSGGLDDELYDISDFLNNGDTQITVNTRNPSNDDLIFLAIIEITARASVGEICGDGIDNDEDGLIDEGCDGAEPKKSDGGDNQWDTRPTFGISHETRQDQIVENGFRFNSNEFMLTDNHHTDFVEQSVDIGITNSFSATVWADKGLKIQEFLFGIPNVGEAHLAELGVEVWYDTDGNIDDVKVVQKSDVIDADTVSVSHEKVKCLATSQEAKCDTTTVSMTFLEPLADKVMAIKAIDWKLRDQRTFLNEGFDISGESLNPMLTKSIPSTVKHEGLVTVTQMAKYSPYWTTEDGGMFEMNSFGSFKQINQSFERFQDTGNAFTRAHSGFGGIIQYEQNRAVDVFDATKLISELPDSFGYHFELDNRLNEELMQEILNQQEIAREILDEMDKQNRHY